MLEKDCVYIVQLQEHLELRYRTSGSANPKSSTGRLNVFARVITDYGTEFDQHKTQLSGGRFTQNYHLGLLAFLCVGALD